MRRIVSVLLLSSLLPASAHAVFMDCLFFSSFENPGTTDPAALAALNVHNCARKTVEPRPATKIPMMTWDATVAATAQNWANQCRWAHGGTNGYGQNLFGTSASTDMARASRVWANEAPNYNYATNSCSGQCGHYTQVVWRSSTKLGCAVKNCTTGSPFSGDPTWAIAVCDYSPAGNIVGWRPY